MVECFVENYEREKITMNGKKKILMDGIVLPNLTYRCEIRMWNREDRSRIHTSEMSYSRDASGVSRSDGISNAEVYRCGMSTSSNDTV